jgi:hypothetical protein
LVGAVVGEVPVDPADLVARVTGPGHEAGEDGRADGMQPELEGGRDTEVAAASVHGPEQLRVDVLARGDFPSVGGDEVDGEQVVAREAEAPLEPAGAASERESGDARGRDPSTGGREAVLLGGSVELPPGDARADACAPPVGVDVDLLHRTQVDHESAVVGGHARNRVSAGANRDVVTVLTREVQRVAHVTRRRAPCNDGRSLVDHRVEQCTRFVVSTITGSEQLHFALPFHADRSASRRRGVGTWTEE